jgi:hypothetical protein
MVLEDQCWPAGHKESCSHLLGEADVALERRTSSDLTCNAMTGVFSGE